MPQELIAIEVDGPLHFSVNAVGGRHWPLGRNAARNRMLEAQGWRVLEVDVSAWVCVPAAARSDWLLQRLEAVRGGKPGSVALST